MLLKNKKGIADAIYWFIRIMILIAAVASIIFIRDVALGKSLETHDVEYELLINRMLFSKITYQDLSTGREYPGIIDLANFNEGTINESFRGITTAFMLDLNYLDGTNAGLLYNNKERYVYLDRITWAKQYVRINKTYYVLVKDNEDLKPAKLNVEVLFGRK